MKFALTLFLIGLLGAFCAHVEMDIKDKGLFDSRNDWARSGYADGSQLHTVMFAIKQNNLDVLEKIFWEVSDPKHPKWGKHLTRQQVADITAHQNSTAIVSQYLNQQQVEMKVSPYGEFITAKAPIGVWERLFATTFYEFKHVEGIEKPVARSLHYSLDSEIAAHVSTVFNTIDPPVLYNHKPQMKLLTSNKTASIYDGTIVPATLNAYYGVTSNAGNKLGSQSVFETIGQYYSPSDLTQFQNAYGLPVEPVAVDIGGYESDSACVSNANNCVEANLDVQYMMAMSQTTPTTYYYDAATNSFVDFVQSLSAMADPPKINSISYGSTESSLPSATCNTFNTEAMKLGAQGVSIFVSSGDDGVAGSGARTNPKNCGYSPSFPATSQYVTAVGATQGPEIDATEKVCSASTGGVITSGGGFSTKYAMPAYQTSAVNGYFAGLTAGQTPVTGYVSGNRAYPDISLAGYNYEVVVGGKTYAVSGTSASSPVSAGMISLINAARLAAGKSALGFINQALYQAGTSITYDVVGGENNCAASVVCCSQGFYATAGWDPATGLGSINYSAFYNYFVGLA